MKIFGKRILSILIISAVILILYFTLIKDSYLLIGKNDLQTAALHFAEDCTSCHKKDIREYSETDWQIVKNKSDMFRLIKSGNDTLGMPSFSEKFNDKEIKALIKYIKLSKKDQIKYSEQIPDNTAQVKFIVDTVINNLEIPWGMEFLPNGDLLISERNGVLYRYTADEKLIEIKGLPQILVKGQGGLMDIKLHPNFSENGWIYFSYVYIDENDGSKGNTAILRAKLGQNKLVESQILYKAVPATDKKYHFGCRIDFDNHGYMYFSVGDRGDRDSYPQSLDNSNGKIHRLFDDGTIPPDNPFVNSPGAVKSIFSYGHRNPQGLAKNPETGAIWIHEHGPKGGDEINIIRKGFNYGWPVISYGINYDGTVFTEDTARAGMEQPILYYVPSIAPCGMAWITGSKYPGWENNLLIGSLSFHYLERCVIKNDKVVKQERLLEDIGRVRNVKISPDGYIYVAIEEPGKILKLIPKK